MSIICNLILNPSKINIAILNMVNCNFGAPLHQSQIFIENGMLFYKAPICDGLSYTCLQLIPWELYNILFIAFHSSLLGGHINAYRTLHRLCPWYYWPGMYSYINKEQVFQACVQLSNQGTLFGSYLSMCILRESTLALMARSFTWLHAAA